MKHLAKLNLVLLTLLALSTGLVKIFGMKEEVELFAHIGITGGLFVAFGVVQLLAGLALVHPRSRRYGAAVLIPTFLIATSALFVAGVHPFSFLSLSFIGMALVPLLSGTRAVTARGQATA